LEAILRLQRRSSQQKAMESAGASLPFSAISTEPLDWLMHINEVADYRQPAGPGSRPLGDLVQDVWSAVRSATTSFWAYLRKVIAATMVIASSLTASAANIRNFAFANSVIAAITAVPRAAHASALKKYKQLSPTQKLATTPLFFVCNSGGQPYLQDDIQAGKPEQKIVVYFMSSEDANDYLNEVRSET
jgi:hypothetical protein